MSQLLRRKLTHTSDPGAAPEVLHIENKTLNNNNYRSVLWTGKNMQLTVMTIKAGEDVGLERHSNTDQFLRLESGSGMVKFGLDKNNLNCVKQIHPGDAVMVPKNTWHNIINSGSTPMKLYSVYSLAQHRRGIVQKTKSIAEKDE